MDGARQRAFVSAGRGIHRIALAEAMAVVDVTPRDLPVELRSHGLSLYTGADGAQFLFVVNHAPAQESVLIFAVAADGSLTFREAIGDPAFHDVAAVGPRQFYVTNSYSNSFGRQRYSSAFNIVKLLSLARQ